MGDESVSVKVAVRVRPFNQREIDRKCRCVISMSENATVIVDPDTGKENTFSFDHSYWSMDHTSTNEFATQETVFNDLGKELLTNAWEGYNCCIFAYGQTGSGKSYSMLGYGEDKGIIPRICEEMFNRMNQNFDDNTLFKVEVSFMEIYNEKVKDLLNPKNTGSLKVRNHPKIGPYVEDLSKIAVNSFKEIETLMDEGTKTRTVASTNMNATSSRSHAVFTIEFTHSKIIDREQGQSLDKVSKINLVDLAGSERVTSTGSSGARLKEGANINKSLSTLGKVIAALAINSSGNAKKMNHVPYRDSALTWLLKESLGGNAKTIMIAALSPADINYGETLSTLRYADNAKKIKCNAVVNEDPTSKLIRDLKAEVEQLRVQLTSTDPTVVFSKDVVVSKLTEELEQREKLIAEMNKTWEQRLVEAQALQQERKAALQDMGVAIQVVSTVPHLVNLNEDPLMSENLIYYLHEGRIRVGKPDAANPQDIRLNGLSMAQEHCVIDMEDGEVTISPVIPEGVTSEDAIPAVFINGVRIFKPEKLSHGSRLILGNHHIFRFNHPEEAKSNREKSTSSSQIIDWSFAVKELAAAQGKMLLPDETEQGYSEEDERRKLEDKVLQAILLINEANALCSPDALNNEISFNLKLVSNGINASSSSTNLKQLLQLDKTELSVTVANKSTKESAVWNYDTFVEKLWDLRDAYQSFIESGTLVPEEFELQQFRAQNEEQLVGVAHVYPKNLLHLLKTQRTIPLLDPARGTNVGDLMVEIVPYFEDENEKVAMIEDPKTLLGKKLCFSLRILRATNMPASKYSRLHCKYNFWDTQIATKTLEEKDTVVNSKRKVIIDRVNEEFLEYLDSNIITYEAWGVPKSTDLNTSEESSIELFASVNIMEEDGEHYLPVPIKEEHSKQYRKRETPMSPQNHFDTLSVFLVRRGQKRRFVLNLIKCSEENVFIESCTSSSVGNLRLKKIKMNNSESSLNLDINNFTFGGNSQTPKRSYSIASSTATPIRPSFVPQASTPSPSHQPVTRTRSSRSPSVVNLPSPISSNRSQTTVEPPSPQALEFRAPNPAINAVSDHVKLSVHTCNKNTIVLDWDTTTHMSPLLAEKTLKGYVVSLTLQLVLALTNSNKPFTVKIPVYLKVVEPHSSDFKEPASLLEQFKGLITTKGGDYQLNGSLLSIKLVKKESTELDETAVTDLIDEHQENLMKLGNAIEQERLKQELELHEQLTPAMVRENKENIEQQLFRLQSSSGSFRKRRRGSILLQTVASEVHSSDLHRDVEMCGYLQKKGTINKKWKQFWFILSRPYLYYYSNSDLQNEKAIDLTNSAITAVEDEPSPNMFAIVTWKRVWLLRAANQEDLRKWMKALNPLGSSVQETKLQLELDLSHDQLERKERLVTELSSKLSQQERLIQDKVKVVSDFMSRFTTKLYQLQNQLLLEQEEVNAKNAQIQELEEKNALLTQAQPPNAKLEGQINSGENGFTDHSGSNGIAKHLPENGHVGDSQEEKLEIKTIKEELNTIKEAHNATQLLLTNSNEENKKLKEKLASLSRELLAMNEEIQAKNKVIEMWEQTNEESKGKILEQQSIIESLSSKVENQVKEIATSKKEIAALEAEMIEKEYQVDVLGSTVKNLEDDLKQESAKTKATEEKLKIHLEELKAKDLLLSEQLSAKIPKNEDRGLFSSKSEVLEKQVAASKQAIQAHQLQNSFLYTQLTRAEKDMNLQVGLRNQTIARLKKEVTLLRRRFFNLSREKGARMSSTPDTIAIEAHTNTTQFELLKKKYFNHFALGMKMNLSNQGIVCNVDVNTLWDQAEREGVINFEEYPAWIEEKILENSDSPR